MTKILSECTADEIRDELTRRRGLSIEVRNSDLTIHSFLLTPKTMCLLISNTDSFGNEIKYAISRDQLSDLRRLIESIIDTQSIIDSAANIKINNQNL